MNLSDKARILSDAGKWDLCSPLHGSQGGLIPGSIYTTFAGGQQIQLFKTLMSNVCVFDCKYCQNPHCKKPVMFEPQELAQVFKELHDSGQVSGLFLSSGIFKDPAYTTENMIEAVKLIRQWFNGYIHFKVLPGTSKEHVKQASELANRLSINIEAPSKQRLDELSSVKDFKKDIIKQQEWIKEVHPKSGQTTQMIVGAGNETDLELLKTAEWEYEKMGLSRVYYSAFKPIPETPLEGQAATARTREHKLYSVDFMMRQYGIPLKDFKAILIDGNLPGGDPKINLALEKFGEPVDPLQADYEKLLRVPGIGPVRAQTITLMRELDIPLNQQNLKKIGIKRSEPFLRLEGHSQKKLEEY
jgi:predicted DNA-binding helix-hairpin-helix protein